MKKYLLALVCLVATSALYAQKGEKTLYIVDGKATSKEAFEAISPDQIKNIDLFKDIEGAVVVTTKEAKADSDLVGDMELINVQHTTKAGEPQRKYTTLRVTKDQGKVVVDEDTENVVVVGGSAHVKQRRSTTTVMGDPLFLLKAKDGSFKALPGDALQTIDPATIKAITVLKDEKVEAYAQYGDVKNGVIIVELK